MTVGSSTQPFSRYLPPDDQLDNIHNLNFADVDAAALMVALDRHRSTPELFSAESDGSAGGAAVVDPKVVTPAQERQVEQQKKCCIIL